MKLTKRALSLLPDAADKTPVTLQLLAQYAAQNPGLEYGNYRDRAAYLSDSRKITKDLRHVRDALRDAYYSGAGDVDLAKAARHAFSGRLQFTFDADGAPTGIGYCTGQYWPTEYRRACAAVLEEAASVAIARTNR